MELISIETKAYTTEKYLLAPGFFVERNLVDYVVKSSEFKSDKGKECRFVYIPEIAEFKEKLTKLSYSYTLPTNEHEYWWDHYILKDPYTYFSEGNVFNPVCVVENILGSHEFKDIKGNYLPIAKKIDYTDGFIQSRGGDGEYGFYHWEALVAHLKQHPNVLSVKEEVVSYYNSDFNGQKGLTVMVTVLPEWWAANNDKSWDCRSPILFGDKDPLGIKQFRNK